MRRLAVATVAVTATMSLGAVGASASAHGFRAVPLVADQSGRAPLADHQLVNPWGLAFAPGSPIWVADNGSDSATLYQGGVDGSAVSKVPLTVKVTDGEPTGQVFNGGSGFVVSDGTNKSAALFLFSSEAGAITGWAPSVGGGAVAERGAAVKDAVFKSLAIAPSGTHSFLYAADFHHNKIDVFDEHFHLLSLPGRFVDSHLPSHYAPFNIQLIGRQLYVTYAVQDTEKHDDSAGLGHGIVDVYTRSGHLMRRLVTHGALNSPWGLVLAPSSFGRLAGALLVGNFGDGKVNAYDRHSGRWLATLSSSNGKPLVIDGLWGLAIGNGKFGGTDEVVFSAGTDGEAHGTLGVIQAH